MKMKKFSNVATILTMLLLFSLLFAGCGQQVELTELYPYVFDAGTYTSLDYKYADAYFAKEYDNWGGGCSAVAKVLDDGTMLVGRNMDLNISNKAAYVIRTAVEGCYETIGLAYTYLDISPDYEVVKEKGLPNDFAKVLPFMCDDVMNSEGLYIELNLREGEYWPTGEAKFSCSGTNPDSESRVYLFQLTRYIGEHCATVDEALEYIKGLNIYSKEGFRNYCFLMADATGHFGLLEFAQDQVLWHDGQPAQTNFYIDWLMNAIEELKCGVGRYEVLMAGRDAVKSEEDMLELMKKVNYYQVYDPENCQFDYRSENVGALPFATYDFLMQEENREYIFECVKEVGDQVRALSRQEQRDKNEYWESAFTEVANCSAKTIFVRFFEDDSQTLKLGFD